MEQNLELTYKMINKKIEIEIPEEINTKNWVFSYCLASLKKTLWLNSDFKGSLKPLWDTELISMDKLLKTLNMKLWRDYNMDDLSFHMREYERESSVKISPIKKYSNVSDSKVFLVDDLNWFKLYLLKINKNDS